MSSSGNAASCEGLPEASPSASDPLRIVLLGRTGTGRSSSGNTILGRPAFCVDVSPCSVTTHCQKKTFTVDGRSISVTDTPGFLHTQLAPQELMAEVGRCVVLSSPGPHVFLVTVQPGRFMQEDRDTLEWIEAIFGPKVTSFTVVLFTWGDQLQGKAIEDFIEESDELSEFISSCQKRYHVFENRNQNEAEERPHQVAQLLQKIDKMVAENGGSYYSSEMFEEAERAVRAAQERILKERGFKVELLQKEAEGPALERGRSKEEERRKEEEEEEARKRAERLFWTELVTALGRGAAEGAGIVGKDKGKGKTVKKVKVVEKAAALAASPLSIRSAAKVVEGAVREGSKVIYKHRKTFLR